MGTLRRFRFKTRRRERDLDQIYEDKRDLKKTENLLNSPLDENLPGLGQFYCIECAKYFENEYSRKVHHRGKNHKRRVKLLKEQPYTQEEADAGAGNGVQIYLAKKSSYNEAA